MLEVLGLGPTAEAVYRALLRAPASTPGALAEAVSSTADDVHAELRGLHERGLVRADVRNPGRFVPVHPEVAVAALLAAEQAELTRRQADLVAVRVAVNELTDDFVRGSETANPRVAVEVLDGLPSIRSRIDELLRGCRSTLAVVADRMQDVPEAIEQARTQDFALLGRGVAIRTLYPPQIRELPLAWSYARECAHAGEQARVGTRLPGRMLLCDREVAVLPVDRADPRAGALVVWSPPLVEALLSLFELAWDSATPLFGASGQGRGDREEQLLQLLASGAKDATVARQLNVALRTMRRSAAVLMADLDADTRFQAGVEAARRGWV